MIADGTEPKRQRAIRATDSDWERVTARAAAAGMSISDYVLWRALASPAGAGTAAALPDAVQVRCAQAVLTLFACEERRMAAGGEAEEWRTIETEVGRWIELQEGMG